MLHNFLRIALTDDNCTRVSCIREVDGVCGRLVIAGHESATGEVAVKAFLLL